MEIKDSKIDKGNAFDFGKTSKNYALYRDIYPKEFWRKVINLNLCIKDQTVLDVGTGTGVLPRSLYSYGAKFTASDISENQIEQAKILSDGMDINYIVSPAEDLSFKNGSFDVITACQCFCYFKHEKTAPLFNKMLKDGGHFLALYMAWLPFEDKIAGMSEDLILKYNPSWSGCGETMHDIELPACYNNFFEVEYKEAYPLNVHFTRESWHGRIKTCRGIGAALNENEIKKWEEEHKNMLLNYAPEEFFIKHYAAILSLKKKTV